MEKRNMLTFSISAQIFIETFASLFLLGTAYKLFEGVYCKTQGRTGSLILFFFACLFLTGGIAGLIKCGMKYKKHKQNRREV